MLAIRMQRTGRSGHAHFRVVVQDSRQSPKSGKFVALLGSYDPHAKVSSLDKDKAQAFIKNGAQPSERVVALLKHEGVKLPDWVATPTKKEAKIRNPEKLRRNRPAEAPKEESQTPVAEAKTETPPVESAEETTSEIDETEAQPQTAEAKTHESTSEQSKGDDASSEAVPEPEQNLPEPENKS